MKTTALILGALAAAAIGCGTEEDPSSPTTYTAIVRAECVPGSGAKMDPCNSYSDDGLPVFQCSGFAVNDGCVTKFYGSGQGQDVACTSACGVSP